MEAAWRERRRRGGRGDGVKEKAVAWRLGDFNVRERHLCFVCGENGGVVVESGSVVVEGVASWWRGRRRGGDGSTLEAEGFQRERERERERERNL
jgi:hypothetical protein